MTDAITRENLFRPVPKTPRSKAELTDSTSRAIVQAETDSREAKTQRLRQARLQMEARQPQPVPTKGRNKKAGRTRSLTAL
ncbi:hypothetical protein R2G56_03200 [Nitratireductor aquimarinus]|uniref:Uncharacterized protein n=1 Tax=Nitratireductor aquimarinus TaxID=889300 RepID=A0ABU4AGC5_9HYPH|nr:MULTISPECIES: hypothetical protein [Nitratireductor]MCV0350921.1 hypothetical protein [Nitratireductor sp.]MDV6225283.1 hypothetical protein [Nitratireductor aquimarinus]